MYKPQTGLFFTLGHSATRVNAQMCRISKVKGLIYMERVLELACVGEEGAWRA